MEALIGIVGHDFVLLAADRVAARSIVVMKATEDKFRDLNRNVSLAFAGEPGDSVTFAEFIQRNVQLYGIRNDLPLTTQAAAHFTRRELAEALRSRNPYSVNMLIGGCNDKDGPELFWLDYIAALSKVPFAAHGYAAYFVLSLLDRHYRPDLSVEEAIKLLQMCLLELKTRFIVNMPEFSVRIVRASGIESITLTIPSA